MTEENDNIPQILLNLDEMCLCLSCTMPEACRQDVDTLFFNNKKNFDRLKYIEENCKGTKRIATRLSLKDADTVYKLQCICDIYTLAAMEDSYEKIQKAYNTLSKLVNLLKPYSYDVYRLVKKNQNNCISLMDFLTDKYAYSEDTLLNPDTYSANSQLVFDCICFHVYMVFFAALEADEFTARILTTIKQLYRNFISEDYTDYRALDKLYESIYGHSLPTDKFQAIEEFIFSPVTESYFTKLGFYEEFDEVQYPLLAHIFKACSKENTISTTGICIALYETVTMLCNDSANNEALTIRCFNNQIANANDFFYDLIFDNELITIKEIIRRIFLLMMQSQLRSDAEIQADIKKGCFEWEDNPIINDTIAFIENGINAAYICGIARQNKEAKRFIIDTYGATSLINQKHTESQLLEQAKQLQTLANSLALQKVLLEQSQKNNDKTIDEKVKKATVTQDKKIAELQEEIKKLSKLNDKLTNENAILSENLSVCKAAEETLLSSLDEPDQENLPAIEEMIQEIKKHKFTCAAFEKALEPIANLFEFDSITSERDKIEKNYRTECIFVLTRNCSHALFYKITSLKYPYFFINSRNTDVIVAEIYKRLKKM